MLRDRAARRRAIVYAMLVAASLLLLATSNTAPIETARRGVNFAIAPIQDVFAGGVRALTSMFDAVAEIDQLRHDNASLEARVKQLEDQNAELQVVKLENQRLSELLRTQGTLDYATVPAFVVARQSTQFERVVTLDRGTAAGVEVGDAVLSPGGALAGEITDAGSNWASARLLSDTRSLVIGMDQVTRATGEVKGNLSGPLAMGNVPVTDGLAVGHPVITAGIQLARGIRSSFPKGLLIGAIVDVEKDAAAIVQTALVQPAADLDHIEAVLVVTSYHPPALPTPTVAAPEPSLPDLPTYTPAPTRTPKVKPSKAP
jgi:rod shape-determining protein MreC